jgi:hypothetical protein
LLPRFRSRVCRITVQETMAAPRLCNLNRSSRFGESKARRKCLCSQTHFGSCSKPSFRDADADAECHAATHHLAAVTLYGFFLVAPRFFSDPSPRFSGCSGNLFVTAGQVSELGGGGGRQDPAVSWSG